MLASHLAKIRQLNAQQWCNREAFTSSKLDIAQTLQGKEPMIVRLAMLSGWDGWHSCTLLTITLTLANHSSKCVAQP